MSAPTAYLFLPYENEIGDITKKESENAAEEKKRGEVWKGTDKEQKI